MELVYRFDKTLVDISEQKDETDVVFSFRFHDAALEKQFAEVRHYFYDNDDLTDAYFLTNLDKEVKVTIKESYYIELLTQLFKHQIITSLEWR